MSKMLFSIGLSSLMITLIPIVPSFGKSLDSFTIDTKLSGEKFMGFYVLPDDAIKLGNGSRICPSDDCKVIIDKSGANWLSNPEPDLKGMNIDVYFRLQDNKTNGHFTPKKQALIEQMSLSVNCYIQDIEENVKSGTTKYICKNAWGAFFYRSFNNTSYNYRANLTFELPSGHLVVYGIWP